MSRSSDGNSGPSGSSHMNHLAYNFKVGREEWRGVRTKRSAMKEAYERRMERAYSASARMKKADYFLGRTMFKRIVPKYEDFTWLLQTC